jgi:hypothetical protein
MLPSYVGNLIASSLFGLPRVSFSFNAMPAVSVASSELRENFAFQISKQLFLPRDQLFIHSVTNGSTLNLDITLITSTSVGSLKRLVESDSLKITYDAQVLYANPISWSHANGMYLLVRLYLFVFDPEYDRIGIDKRPKSINWGIRGERHGSHCRFSCVCCHLQIQQARVIRIGLNLKRTEISCFRISFVEFYGKAGVTLNKISFTTD